MKGKKFDGRQEVMLNFAEDAAKVDATSSTSASRNHLIL
jgi:hypothetical protein